MSSRIVDKESIKMLTKTDRLTENFFLIALGLYLAYSAITATTFYLPMPAHTIYVIFLLLAVGAFLRLLVNGIRMVCEREKERILCVMAAMVFAGICVLSYRSTGYSSLLFLGLAAVGMPGIRYQKLLKTWLLSVGLVLLLTVLASLSGFIINFVKLKNGHIRSSWGTGYPTDFASWVLFSMMFLWLYLERFPRILQPVFACIAFAIAYFIAYAVNSSVCSLLFFIAILIVFFYGKLHLPHRAERIVRWVLTFIFPILASIMFALMALYLHGNSFAYFVDTVVSSRISLAVEAFKNYGITAFGTAFEMNGAGFSSYTASDYNFVDSSYALILLRYGTVFFAFLVVLWVGVTVRAIWKRDRKLICVLTVIAVHALMEHHFTELHFNILLLIPFSTINIVRISEFSFEEEMDQVIRAFLRHLPSVCLLALLCVFLPSIFATTRTLAETANLYGGGRQEYGVITAILGIGVVLILTLRSIDRLWIRWFSCDNKTKLGFILQSTGAIAGIAILIFGGVQMFRVQESTCASYSDVLFTEKEGIERILENATGEVYVATTPDVYRSKYPAISTSVFYGDELARSTNATVITRHDDDSDIFIRKGYLFGELSDNYAFYTNDPAVIDAFEQAGQFLKGYYSAERSVNLHRLAAINGLPYASDGVLLRAGDSITYGGNIGLYSGTYTATYKLKIADRSFNEADSVQTEVVSHVQIQIDEETVAEKNITAGDFDENGESTVELKFNTSETGNAAFLIDNQSDMSVLLQSIIYQKTPNLDVHNEYNSKGEVIRSTWYTLSGEPYIFPQGYHACEYSYDAQHNQTMIRYLDVNGQTMVITDGYAEVQKKFNTKKQLIQETYYDSAGEIIIFPKGYSEKRYLYDASGNQTDILFCDSEGNPVRITDGYAEIQRSYDENKKIIQESYFDVTGQQTTLLSGYHSIRYQYDGDGNQVSVQYCDSDGKLTMINKGYAEIRREFASGKVASESYYDTEGEPITFSKKYSSVQYEYDDAGNQIVMRYCDSDGNAVDVSDGYSERHRTYNENKLLITEEYYTSSGTPYTNKNGIVITRYSYDEQGRQIQIQYCDANGNAINITDGYSTVEKQYDSSNRLILEEYLNTDGKPVLTSAGYAFREYQYDSHGNQISVQYFNSDHESVIGKDGYASLIREYDDFRHVIQEAYYDETGQSVALKKGYATIVRIYDERGNQTNILYQDTSGEPVQISDGYAEIIRQYNDMNKVIREEYYGSDNEKVILPAGYAAYHASYDSFGNQLILEYMGINDEAVSRTDGCSEIRKEYDSFGRQLQEAYYDKEGNPVELAKGYASWKREYAPDGQVTSTVYYDKGGNVVTPQN